MELHLYHFLLIIVGILIIFLTYFLTNRKIKKKLKNQTNIHSDRFITIMRVFEQIVSTYKNIYYDRELTGIINSHDLNKDSSTNSFKSFENSKKQLMMKSAKDVIENFISIDLKTELSIYYNDDFLILMIIERFEGQV